MRMIVIGAGVLGFSAAYHLARDGATVTVIDPGSRYPAMQDIYGFRTVQTGAVLAVGCGRCRP
ncbi:FAD-dependent oxidoreductase [Mesorhizobium waimense]|uniref:FAD-dependent oxidoreductase n=2 Tax=Mesorhizobium waimense TaxID=1300307 RepID=A0A3A5JU04_9HYPH|nr:FAD-dependent oxidoreductase [Mesorhizobium waimense]